MSQRTKIKSDNLGLYVIADGWICRPFFGTIFKEGDKVKTHHFPGSIKAGVTFLSENFTRNGRYEVWSTSGVTTFEYSNNNEDIKESYDFYKNHTSSVHDLFSELNNKFREDFNAE